MYIYIAAFIQVSKLSVSSFIPLQREKVESPVAKVLAWDLEILAEIPGCITYYCVMLSTLIKP